MGRAGLTPGGIADTAADLLDRGVPLTLARVAEELAVRPPSLYNHIDGLEGLVRLVALDGLEELAEVCRTAVMGRAGSDALHGLAAAYREYARAHPGVYPLTQVTRPGDPDYEQRAARILEPVFALLTGFGLGGDDLIHAARAVRSALHGFVTLESWSGFGLEIDLDRSYRWMVAALERGLTPA